jgi:dTDP-D-glucose 4,6-dehydratase
MMRVLITGGAGFIGRRVLDNGWTPSRERPRRGP